MWHQKNQLSVKKSINLQKIVNEIQNISEFEQNNLGGFIQNGKFSWIVNGSTIEIFSTETGTRLSYCNFSKCPKTKNCIITCVEEIKFYPSICILAIVVEFSNGAGGMISIFCVQGSKILGSIDFCEKISSCKQITQEACKMSVLRLFRGCIAIGTDQGKVFLIDIMLPPKEADVLNHPNQDSQVFLCSNILANVDQSEIGLHHRKVARENSYFSIQLEVLNDSSGVLSLLCLSNLFTLAVGLQDGRLVLYDLKDLQAFHLAYPPSNHSPLKFMSYLEPIDDPRSCVYIWAFHTSADGAIGVMHSLMYEDKVNSIYENFKSCNVRLTMPIFDKDSSPIACRSIRKVVSQDEEDVLTLNLLAWNTQHNRQSKILIFDLNQWYKEEMPSFGDWRQQLNYVTTFSLNEISTLDVFVIEESVFPFNSIQRPEEHFYPNSLSFDVSFLESNKCQHFFWPGVQNSVLEQFNFAGPQALLDPNCLYNEMLKVAIYPQFYDCLFNSHTPIDLKREFLLSVALEYNYTGFLKKCAASWADGSYLGKDANSGLSLSTLTEWIWNRAKSLKEICNSLCEPLFDYSERRIDYGTQKMLSQCSRQMKNLSNLLSIVINNYQKFIPDNVLELLKTQFDSVKMASDYQEVLQWLLNVGVLPEGVYRPNSPGNRSSQDDDEFLIVPYPYCAINSYYMSQRMKFADDYLTRSKEVQEKNCKYLFIDSFIEKECDSKAIHGLWKENGNGLYPPSSIQTLLRTLLIPNIPVENKYILFVYLFMDINSILNEGNKGKYSSIVQNLVKFPTVFKLDSAAIKRTQAFWNLDNGHLEIAVEELISPLSHDKHLLHWQRELLIASLLKQNANSLALRALRSPGNPISNALEIQTLLANNLLSEALRIQRSNGDPRLLVMMFDKIISSSKSDAILDLVLTESEGQILQEYLEKTDLSNCLNMHLVYLLQRSKFIDAVSLMQKVSHSKKSEGLNLQPPTELLTAYHSTLEPTSRHLTHMAWSEREKFHCSNKEQAALKCPSPLSKSLIKSKLNVKNNIYHTSILNISEAGYGEKSRDFQEDDMPFICCPRLGIFEYQQQPPQLQQREVSYPFEINEFGKRRNNERPVKTVPNEKSIIFDDYMAPHQKRRKLNESAMASKKSFKDINLNLITTFRDVKPSYKFYSSNSRNTSKQTTPERSLLFQFQQQHERSLLSTPIIKKRSDLTPEKIFTPSMTPTSILKSKPTSLRNSVSPTPSRTSEFEEKSVKSITFAVPGTVDSSFNDSSLNMDYSDNSEVEATLNASILSSSTDNFYSPIASANTSFVMSNDVELDIPGGPKPRPPLRSRSNTPSGEQFMATKSRSATPTTDAGSKTPQKVDSESSGFMRVTRSRSKTPSADVGSRPIVVISDVTVVPAPTSSEVMDTESEEVSKTYLRVEAETSGNRIVTRSRSKTPNPEPNLVKSKTPTSEEKQAQLRKKIAEEEAELQRIQKERQMMLDKIFGTEKKDEAKPEETEVETPSTSGLQPKTPEKSEQADVEIASPGYSPLQPHSILKDDSETSIYDMSQDSSVQELTIYGKSILKSDFDQTLSDRSDDNSRPVSPIVQNILQYDSDDDDDDDDEPPKKVEEEEVIAEHKGSDSDVEEVHQVEDEQSEYGDFNLNDSDESNVYEEEDPDDDEEQDDGEDDDNDDDDDDTDISNISNKSDSNDIEEDEYVSRSSKQSDVIEILSSSEEEGNNFEDVYEIKQEPVHQKKEPIAPLPSIQEIEVKHYDKEDEGGDLYELQSCPVNYETETVTTTVEIHEEIVMEEFMPEAADPNEKIEITGECATKITKIECVESDGVKIEENVYSSETKEKIHEQVDPEPEPSGISDADSKEIEIQISIISEPKTDEEEKMEVEEPEVAEMKEIEVIPEVVTEPEKVEEVAEFPIPESTEQTDVPIEEVKIIVAPEVTEIVNDNAEHVDKTILMDSQVQSEVSESFVSATDVDDLNNAVIISNLSSMESSVKGTTDQLNEAVVVEEPSEVKGEISEVAEETTDDILNKGLLETTSTEQLDNKEKEVEIKPEMSVVDSSLTGSTDNLNVAIIQTGSTFSQISDTIQEPKESEVDTTNVGASTSQSFEDIDQKTMDVAMIISDMASVVDESVDSKLPETPRKTRSLRGMSAEPTISSPVNPRLLRAKSVPKTSVTSSPKTIRTRRSSTEDRHNPKLLLKEKILEKIEEHEEVILTPSRIMTRRQSNAESPAAPLTPTRRGRRKSLASDDGNDTPSKKSRRLSTDSLNTPDTPRRLTRAASRELLSTPKALIETIEEVVRDDQSEKSEKSTKSTRKYTRKKKDSIAEETEESPESKGDASLSIANRRLTRSQKAVLEKSREISEALETTQFKRKTAPEDSESEDLGGSDVEEKKSVKSSAASGTSKRRGRKKKTSVSEDDNVSVASSKSESPEKRTRAAKLSVIPEESQEVDITIEKSTRTRGRKKT